MLKKSEKNWLEGKLNAALEDLKSGEPDARQRANAAIFAIAREEVVAPLLTPEFMQTLMTCVETGHCDFAFAGVLRTEAGVKLMKEQNVVQALIGGLEDGDENNRQNYMSALLYITASEAGVNLLTEQDFTKIEIYACVDPGFDVRVDLGNIIKNIAHSPAGEKFITSDTLAILEQITDDGAYDKAQELVRNTLKRRESTASPSP